MKAGEGQWRFWIDRGGTFTDVIGLSPDHRLHVAKTPSADGDGGLAAARQMLQLPPAARIPAKRVAEIRVGATIATNALLERRGDSTAVCVTRGFADALLIGDQTRPELFSLAARRPPPLWNRAVEIEERIAANGKIITPLNKKAARHALLRAASGGARAVAIALMHGFSHPAHEKMLADIARAVGFREIAMSHESARLIKYIPRAHTAAVDAYLARPMQKFVADLQSQCENGVRLLFMQSSGALLEADSLRAAQTILSGPAGGASGARKSAAAAGFDKVICFDMGGTSTDVTLGGGELRMENRVGGVPFFAPMLDIHTVAAGGGSIVRRQDNRLLVGPRSAGASPGPACYRQGGPLTVTDCNVMLGKLQPDFFPRLFGKNRNLSLDGDIVRKKFHELIGNASKDAAAKTAEGFARVAVQKMAAAIAKISTARGTDPRACIINSFGGASGQHICAVAEAVGARRAMASRHASVLSAWGIGMADIGAVKRQAADCNLESPKLKKLFAELEKQARHALPPGKPTVECRLLCRYVDSENTIAVARQAAAKMRAAFEKEHRRLYGYLSREREIVAAAAEVEARIVSPPPPTLQDGGETTSSPTATRPVFFDGWRQTPFYDWRRLPVGMQIAGPAIVLDAWNTVVVDPGWRAEAKREHLLLKKIGRGRAANAKTLSRPTAASLEIFHHRLMAVAERMGETLRRTATSVNIRERLDFSCALFDRRGFLIANAPHIPVHLGSMSESVRHLIRANPPGLLRGDSFMLNSPYHGGTHLPDITLIRPGRFDSKNGAPDFFVAARGHHADIGGISPGSMPADSGHIDEEGALIHLCPAVERGRLKEKEILRLLKNAPHPARNPSQNIADLRAQIASLSAGVADMRRAAEEFGANAVAAHMRHAQNNAAAACRRLLMQLKDGKAEAVFDDGAKIKVAIKIDRARRTAVFDFAGTSAAHPRNFNAPPAVARAAVIYCLRLLLGEDMPLNDGLLRPINIRLPRGCMLNPRPPAAVAAGNVEVSQHMADAILAALNVCAHSQGTCNNFTFGAGGRQYYETIAGGGGAGAAFDGTDAMQVHMTNSRASDPEVLECNYPLRLEKFCFRKNSGGKGKHKGGMGAERHLRFLTKGEASILSSRRRVAPKGMRGGEDGKPGRNYVVRADGKKEKLQGCAQAQMNPGDIFVIQTPGGGGWGRKKK